ncbi:hypothetical protein [Neomegalonema sp.]|uniref:hypothetical protein n=1 Tax=Neomegalonema sp. TaxID=2039713 RepID=UPI0026292E40|nr:hypothetical protein [Neomegalonema sp.]MDD2869670.1 hypothetical protein [Neomegalonema sp.]
MKKILFLILAFSTLYAQKMQRVMIPKDSSFAKIYADTLAPLDSTTIFAEHLTLDTLIVQKYIHNQEVSLYDSTSWFADDGDTVKIDPSKAGNVLEYEDDNVTVFAVDSTGDVTIGATSAGANLTVNATNESNIAPALTDGDWTLGAGWESPIAGGVLNKNADGVGTAVPNPALTITMGATYRVTITTGTVGVASGATYTLGGSSGSALSAASTTYVDDITTTTTANLIITPTPTGTRFTITAITVQKLTDATGDLTVQGNLKLSSPIQNAKGTDAIYIGPDGYIGIANKNPTYPLQVTGFIGVSGGIITNSYAGWNISGMNFYCTGTNYGNLLYSANAWYLDNSSWRIGNPTPENSDDWTLNISSDADAGAGTTAEHFRINLAANATPALAKWGFTSTQSSGYDFDKSVNTFKDTSLVNDSYGFTSSNITAYSDGLEIKFKAGVANTGACTLQINALGAKGLKSLHDQDPQDNYIEVGSWVVCIYDTVGTDYFQIVSPDANP